MSTLEVFPGLRSSNSFVATDIVQCYKDIVVGAVDISVPVAAIKALTQYIQENRANTMIEFTRDLEAATNALLTATHNCVSIKAGCELFTRFVTRSGADTNEVRKWGNWSHFKSLFRTLKHSKRALLNAEIPL